MPTAALTPRPDAPAVVLEGLTKTYREGEQQRGVRYGVEATIERGEFIVLLGRSGSGRSTPPTLIGGIEAVIWTDAIQSLVLSLGALLVAALLLFGHPDGVSGALAVASQADKFSLGSWSLTDLATSTVWVVLVYGLFINLTNFGIDQNYIQRYHSAEDEKAARRSL